MDDQKMKTGVGILVIASSAIAIMLTFFFGAFPALLASHYTVTARFPSAPGVGVDTPVQRNGVRIGRVSDITLLPEEGVDVTMEIDEEYMVQQGQVPRVSTGSLVTGDAIIEFVPPTVEQLVARFDGAAGFAPDGQLQPEERRLATEPIPDQAYITGGTVESDPFDVLVGLEGDMRGTMQAVREASNQINGLAKDLRFVLIGQDQRGTDSTSLPTRTPTTTVAATATLDAPTQLAASNAFMLFGNTQNQGRLERLMNEAELAIQDFRTTLGDVQAVVGDPELQGQLRSSIERLPIIMDETAETLQSAQRTLESFERVGRSAERTVENVERFTRPLGDRGEDLVENVLLGLESLNETLGQVSVFGERLNAGQGTLNRLMEDEELYWQIVRIANNAEKLTVELRPIVDDVRIFTDKIARDPRQLGVRGALDQRPSQTGVK